MMDIEDNRWIAEMMSDKVDQQSSRFQMKLERQESRFNERIKQLEARFCTRLEQQENRYNERLRQLEARFCTRLEQQESRYDEKLKRLESRVEKAIEQKDRQLRNDYNDAKKREAAVWVEAMNSYIDRAETRIKWKLDAMIELMEGASLGSRF